MALTFHQVRIFKTKKCRQNAGYPATRCRYLNVSQSLAGIGVADDFQEFLAYSYVGPLLRYRRLTAVTPCGGQCVLWAGLSGAHMLSVSIMEH